MWCIRSGEVVQFSFLERAPSCLSSEVEELDLPAKDSILTRLENASGLPEMKWTNENKQAQTRYLDILLELYTIGTSINLLTTQHLTVLKLFR